MISFKPWPLKTGESAAFTHWTVGRVGHSWHGAVGNGKRTWSWGKSNRNFLVSSPWPSHYTYWAAALYFLFCQSESTGISVGSATDVPLHHRYRTVMHFRKCLIKHAQHTWAAFTVLIQRRCAPTKQALWHTCDGTLASVHDVLSRAYQRNETDFSSFLRRNFQYIYCTFQLAALHLLTECQISLPSAHITPRYVHGPCCYDNRRLILCPYRATRLKPLFGFRGKRRQHYLQFTVYILRNLRFNLFHRLWILPPVRTLASEQKDRQTDRHRRVQLHSRLMHGRVS